VGGELDGVRTVGESEAGMMKRSAISWCDFSGGDLNWLTGCQKVSEGCRFCYAEAIYKRFGRDFSILTFDSRKLGRALRACYPQDGNVRGPHSRPLCFPCDTSDFFIEGPCAFIQKYAIEWIGQREDVDWAILTKRPEKIPGDIAWPDNVWLGVTAENQEMADKRIPLLLATSAKVKFVCVEPMLGPVDLGRSMPCGYYCDEDHGHVDHAFWSAGKRTGIDWVICGGESGPKRRPFQKPWASALYAECLDAGAPFFFKQGSGLRPGSDATLGGHVIQEWPR
jgi:protein gp37